MSIRRILYALAAIVALFIVGSVIGGVWSDSDAAGNITVTLWAISIIGAVLLLLALLLASVRLRREV
jgi:F0F1-type ATP synthase membrane subunit c/vacuolar-type H+-ATPase subunit K